MRKPQDFIKPAKLVRYQVIAPVSINGTLIASQGQEDVFILASPGLEGKGAEAGEGAPQGWSQKLIGEHVSTAGPNMVRRSQSAGPHSATDDGNAQADGRLWPYCESALREPIVPRLGINWRPGR